MHLHFRLLGMRLLACTSNFSGQGRQSQQFLGGRTHGDNSDLFPSSEREQRRTRRAREECGNGRRQKGRQKQAERVSCGKESRCVIATLFCCFMLNNYIPHECLCESFDFVGRIAIIAHGCGLDPWRTELWKLCLLAGIALVVIVNVSNSIFFILRLRALFPKLNPIWTSQTKMASVVWGFHDIGCQPGNECTSSAGTSGWTLGMMRNLKRNIEKDNVLQQ